MNVNLDDLVELVGTEGVWIVQRFLTPEIVLIRHEKGGSLLQVDTLDLRELPDITFARLMSVDRSLR